MRQITGRCLCNSIEYSFVDDFKYSGYCHCSECRKFSGSVFSAVGGVAQDDFKIIQGEEFIGRYQKSEASIMCFCKQCGSSLFAEKPKIEMIHLRLGSLDEAASLKPQFHVYTASKVDWYTINDGLPQYEAMPITET